MKKNAWPFALFMLIMLMGLDLTGCSFSKNGLAQAEKEAGRYTGSSSPSIHGLTIKEIEWLSDPQDKEHGSVVFVFTNSKGKLDPSPGGGDQELYGPFEGAEIATLTVSRKEIQAGSAMETKTINGLKVDYATVKDHIVMMANSNHNSYTYEAKITSNFNEQKHFEQFYEAVSSSSS